MAVRDKLESYAYTYHDICRNQINELLAEFGRTISDMEELGCLVILLEDEKYSASNYYLKPIDIKKINEWSQNRRSNRLPLNLYKINLSNTTFLFNKYRSQKRGKIILIGILFEKKDELRFITTCLQSKELPNFRVETAI